MNKTYNTHQRLWMRLLIVIGLACMLLPAAAFAVEPPAEIEVYVMRSDGQEFGPYTISEADGWYLAIPDMEKYDATGALYTYTIVEVPVTGFTTNVTEQVDTRLNDYYYMMNNETACVVTFDGNGGTVLPENAIRTIIPTTTLGTQMPPDPTRDFFTFQGWNTAADGSGTVFNAYTVVNDDITVYAQWASNLPPTFDTGIWALILSFALLCVGSLILARQIRRRHRHQH